MTTGSDLIPLTTNDRLPTDNGIRTRLWDADFNLRYDSGLPGAVDVETATRNFLGLYDPLHVTHDSVGWGRWCGRVRLGDSDQIEYVDEYEYLTKIATYPNPLLEASV